PGRRRMSESVNSISPPRSGQRSGGVARQGRGGAVRRTAGKPRWFAGSLRSRPLPPSGYSPSRAGGDIQIQVPLPPSERAPSVKRIAPLRSGQGRGGVARLGRGGAVRRTAGKPRWFAGSLRSRPLPPSGYSPSRAGGEIQIQVPLPPSELSESVKRI